MESWISLGGKEGHTKIQISAKLGSNWGPCGQEAEILPTAPTMPAQNFMHWSYFDKLYPSGDVADDIDIGPAWSNRDYTYDEVREQL